MSSDTDHGVEEVLVVPYVRNREEGRTSRPTTSSESDIDVYCLKESVPYTRDRHERSPATTSSDSETEVESLPYGRDRSLLMPEAPSGFNKRHPFLQNSSRDDSENEHPVKKFRSYLCQSAGTEESMEHTGPSDGEQMSNYI